MALRADPLGRVDLRPTRTPSPVQRSAWRRLWQLLVEPRNDSAPSGARHEEASDGGAVAAAPMNGGTPNATTTPPG
jgi:hypothetical protein